MSYNYTILDIITIIIINHEFNRKFDSKTDLYTSSINSSFQPAAYISWSCNCSHSSSAHTISIMESSSHDEIGAFFRKNGGLSWLE